MNYTEQVRKHQYKIARYIRIILWARRRYTNAGMLVVRMGAEDSRYTAIEKMAWDRYM